MISDASLSHLLVLLGAVGCVHTIIHESRGRRLRPGRLFAPALFAAVTALVPLIFPAIELWLPAVWGIALIVGLLGGLARGWLMRLYVDHLWGFVRLPRAQDGLLIAVALTLLVMLEMAAASAGFIGTPYHSLLAAGVAFCTGVLAGRAWAISMRVRRWTRVGLRPR